MTDEPRLLAENWEECARRLQGRVALLEGALQKIVDTDHWRVAGAGAERRPISLRDFARRALNEDGRSLLCRGGHSFITMEGRGDYAGQSFQLCTQCGLMPAGLPAEVVTHYMGEPEKWNGFSSVDLATPTKPEDRDSIPVYRQVPKVLE